MVTIIIQIYEISVIIIIIIITFFVKHLRNECAGFLIFIHTRVTGLGYLLTFDTVFK